MTLHKRRRTSPKKKMSRGSSKIYIIFIMVTVLAGFMFVRNLDIAGPINDATVVNIKPPKNENGKDNLQLYTFDYATIAPTSPPPAPDEKKPDNGGKPPDNGAACGHDQLKGAGCDCPSGSKATAYCNENLDDCNKNGGLKNDLPVPNPYPPGKLFCMYTPDQARNKEKLADTTNCVAACIDKPVIYLYPTKPTLVDVSVVSPGRIFVSDPLYPTGGWKNVLAHPDGRLLYEAKEYKELYYETAVSKVNPPKTGIVIATANLDEKLGHIVDQLGLRGEEKKEFMDYWIPRLIKLNSPYILFSILDQDEKERLDHVDIYPKPDTFINFIAYFKAVNTPFYPIDPLILPQAPKRTGFTAVEWGGTISNE